MPLAGNAQYWLGETYYVRKDYENAATAFALGYQKYPKSAKAADDLLKLGMSLGNLGKKPDACTRLRAARPRLPDRARQHQGARGERAAAGRLLTADRACRGGRRVRSSPRNSRR